MKKRPKAQDPAPSIEELYPELSPEKQAEAEEALTAYAALLVRMVERRAAERAWTAHDGDGTKATSGSR